MIPITKTAQKTTETALARAVAVAEHYGFLPIESIMPEHSAHKTRLPKGTHLNSFDRDLASIIGSYIDHGHTELKEPVLFYQRSIPKQSGSRDTQKVRFGLHIIGASHSIAEAILIKTALATLDDIGISERRVHVNSIGDRDSSTRFAKELTNFMRKHIEDLPAGPRHTMKKDVFSAYEQLLRKQHELCASAPSTVEFLTEASRAHLREVLEYFEVAGVDYELDPTIIGSGDCYSKTLFEIRAPQDADETLALYARGGRYDELSQRLSKERVPATGIIFEYEKKGRLAKEPKKKKGKKPKFYFIQVGFEARLRSLVLIETLRKARIPVYQTLGKDQLSAQLELAEQLSIPYCVIMGHKEALDKTVIVRNMDTRSQEIIPVDELTNHLKSL